MKIPSLMYHDVVEPGQADASGFPGGAAAHYKLDVAEFDTHLEALVTLTQAANEQLLERLQEVVDRLTELENSNAKMAVS